MRAQTSNNETQAFLGTPTATSGTTSRLHVQSCFLYLAHSTVFVTMG